MSRFRDLTGQRFGRLVALSWEVREGRTFWRCCCDCGKERFVAMPSLVRNLTKSCGCLQRENRITHGVSRLLGYHSWEGMLRRCYNPSEKKYPLYGGRGIRVCEFLRASPRNLIDLLGPKPNRGMSIDRQDNDGSYTCGQCAECLRCGYPLNVRWATFTQQNRNKRTTVMITAEGRTQSLTQWAEEKGIHPHTLRNRLRRGTALFAPLCQGHSQYV